ncbi:MAG: citrate synthase [Gemmatimonadaceae bacterium]|nr:citrate synthase [Gemmatimonadaceae bacterium]
MRVAVEEGLEGVVAARTRLSGIDGEEGRLWLGGLPVEELAPKACFEETVHLLWNGELPDGAQLDALQGRISGWTLPGGTRSLIVSAVEAGQRPIDVLRLALDSLCLEGAESDVALVGATPVIVAAVSRSRKGKPVIPPDPGLRLAANFLYMMTGRPPTEARARALDTYLNTMVDHGMNASTFTARVITSTRSDLKSAVVGALGALKGPLHGGAPEPALTMLQEIGVPDRAEPFIRTLLERGERLMGFGHREYKARDPRAAVLAQAAEDLCAAEGDTGLLDLACIVEAEAVRLLEEYKPGRRLFANAEFYTAVLLHELGVPPELFSSTFAVSRMAGWIAHCREQEAVGRIFRPQSEYAGREDGAWVDLEERCAVARQG